MFLKVEYCFALYHFSVSQLSYVALLLNYSIAYIRIIMIEMGALVSQNVIKDISSNFWVSFYIAYLLSGWSNSDKGGALLRVVERVE